MWVLETKKFGHNRENNDEDVLRKQFYCDLIWLGENERSYGSSSKAF